MLITARGGPATLQSDPSQAVPGEVYTALLNMLPPASASAPAAAPSPPPPPVGADSCLCPVFWYVVLENLCPGNCRCRLSVVVDKDTDTDTFHVKPIKCKHRTHRTHRVGSWHSIGMTTSRGDHSATLPHGVADASDLGLAVWPCGRVGDSGIGAWGPYVLRLSQSPSPA